MLPRSINIFLNVGLLLCERANSSKAQEFCNAKGNVRLPSNNSENRVSENSSNKQHSWPLDPQMHVTSNACKGEQYANMSQKECCLLWAWAHLRWLRLRWSWKEYWSLLQNLGSFWGRTYGEWGFDLLSNWNPITSKCGEMFMLLSSVFKHVKDF